MKEYKVGEVFTTEDGKTVQCVRSNGLCSGCVFLTKIGDAPRCKAMDIDCSECSREDGQHVIFEELEEFEEHTDYPVGKVLSFKGEAVEVVDNNQLYRDCAGCVFFGIGTCNDAPCIPSERVDDGYVKFKKHVTEK